MWMTWKRCGFINGIDLSNYEVHPDGMIRNANGNILRGELHGKGLYPTISVIVGGKRKRIRIHTIMLSTFFPRPHPSLEVDHRNGDHGDYSLKNLRWVSGPLNRSYYRESLSRPNLMHKLPVREGFCCDSLQG